MLVYQWFAVITFELKNQLTKQNVDDAVQQYKDDRDPREVLFSFKRCMVHFAVDDARIKFCTKLSGAKIAWFLPLTKAITMVPVILLTRMAL